ncbi:MAG: spore germination protein GerW family protein [Calditrichia bacterium]
MENLENLVKSTVGEIERILNTKTVMGEPVKVEDATIIPLIQLGFGFGMGSGSGKAPKENQGEGAGSGLGGGGGVKPIAMVVIDKNGVRVEPLSKGRGSVVEKIGEIIPKVMDKMDEKKKEDKKKG